MGARDVFPIHRAYIIYVNIIRSKMSVAMFFSEFPFPFLESYEQVTSRDHIFFQIREPRLCRTISTIDTEVLLLMIGKSNPDKCFLLKCSVSVVSVVVYIV